MPPIPAYDDCTASAGFDWLAAPAELAGFLEPAEPVGPSLEEKYLLVQNEVETSMADPIPTVSDTC